MNHLDIAPRYAGILMGISNGVGTLSGFLCPIVVERLTKNEVGLDFFNVLNLCSIIFIKIIDERRVGDRIYNGCNDPFRWCGILRIVCLW